MDRQYVGIDFHRRRSVIVRKNSVGEKLASVRVANDPLAIAAVIADAGTEPEVVLEATTVAIGRKVLTLVYYGLRDGEIRCLAKASRTARTRLDACSPNGVTPTRGEVDELLEPVESWPDRTMHAHRSAKECLGTRACPPQ